MPLIRFGVPRPVPHSCGPDGLSVVYFTGNSLVLQPKTTREYIQEELEDWARLGVEGHINARHPWLPYHEFVTEPMSRVVGAQPIETVAMNSLTVNLHLLMVSFFRPTTSRGKILIEKGAFPQNSLRSNHSFISRGAPSARLSHGRLPSELTPQTSPGLIGWPLAK